MEAAEQGIVSKEDGLFPDGLVREEKRILEVLRKAKVSGDRHMTKERIAQELGAYGHAVPGVSRGIEALRKKQLIIERVDKVTKETCFVIADAPPKSIHRRNYGSVAAAALRSKVKQLYEDGLKYKEISKQLSIPRGAVSTIIGRLIAKGEVKRRGQGKRGSISEPKYHKVAGPESSGDSLGDETEEDEPEVLEQAGPDVAEILKAFENGANEIRRMGWQVEVQVKLSYPVAFHRGAS